MPKARRSVELWCCPNPNYLRISVLVRRLLRHAVCHLLTVMRRRGKKTRDGRTTSSESCRKEMAELLLDYEDIQEEIEVGTEPPPKKRRRLRNKEAVALCRRLSVNFSHSYYGTRGFSVSSL